jgi:hypothetical protein
MGILEEMRKFRSRRLVRDLPAWPIDGQEEGHIVQVYSGAFPADRVAEFVRQGITSGEVALIVATADHVKQVDALLGPQLGKVVYLDAEDALGTFMVDGHPDRQRFLDNVGDLVEQAAAAGNGRVRAFGEMVVVLCDQGNVEAAQELEDLWNEVSRRHRLKLLCSYPASTMAAIGRTGQTRLVDTHSHAVQPAP